MSLEDVLRICQQQYHLVLLLNRRGKVTLWAPNVRVPRQVRNVIRQYNDELAQRIARSDIMTCPNPDLHRHSWMYSGDQYCCQICALLLAEVSQSVA